MRHDGQGDGAQFTADLDTEMWTWTPGVRYEAGWRSAKEAADALNAALASAGLPREQMRATAGNYADGRGMVRLKGTPYGARLLVALLERGAGCA